MLVVLALNMGRLSGQYLGALLVVAAFGAAPVGVGYALAAPRNR